MNNNNKQIEEFLRNEISALLKENLPLLEKDILAKKKSIIANLAQTLGKTITSAQKLEQSGIKGAPAYLVISFLRTNILFDIWKYRVDIYDENFLLDKIECSGDFDADFIFIYLKNMLDKLLILIKTSIYANKVRPYHLTSLKIEAAEGLNLIAAALLSNIINDAMRLVEETSPVQIPDLKIMVGEYFDKTILIYEDGK